MVAIENAITVVPQKDAYQQLAERIGNANKIDAIKIYREVTGASLEQAKDFIEALMSAQKIEAIKIHRAITRAGLKEAKDFVEAMGIP